MPEGRRVTRHELGDQRFSTPLNHALRADDGPRVGFTEPA
jgi:hypothetical protein